MEVNRVEVLVVMVRMTIHSNLYVEVRGRVVAHSLRCLIRLHARGKLVATRLILSVVGYIVQVQGQELVHALPQRKYP